MVEHGTKHDTVDSILSTSVSSTNRDVATTSSHITVGTGAAFAAVILGDNTYINRLSRLILMLLDCISYKLEHNLMLSMGNVWVVLSV